MTGKGEIKEIEAKNAAATPVRLIYDLAGKRIAANRRKARATADYQALSELKTTYLMQIIEGE